MTKLQIKLEQLFENTLVSENGVSINESVNLLNILKTNFNIKFKFSSFF
jgi:hypothetical protein